MGDTENDNKITSTTEGKGRENRKEIKTSSGQEDLTKQDRDEKLVSAEAAAKKNNREEKKHDNMEEKATKDSNLNTTRICTWYSKGSNTTRHGRENEEGGSRGNR